jgi:glutathione S-transferase
MRRALRIDAEHRYGRATRRAVFDEVSERLGDGRRYLIGDRFGIAHIACASFASPLLLPEEHPLRGKTAAELLPDLTAEARSAAGVAPRALRAEDVPRAPGGLTGPLIASFRR